MWDQSQEKFKIKEDLRKHLSEDGKEHLYQRRSIEEYLCANICSNCHVQNQGNSRKKNVRGAQMEWRIR